MPFKKNGVEDPSTYHHKLQGTPKAIETTQQEHSLSKL
jgi:hypothetical protein